MDTGCICEKSWILLFRFPVLRSNAGVFGLGPKDGRYGTLRLDKVYFGISAAISGSLVAASCLTVNGDLQITAVSAAPLVNRSHLETFSDSMIGALAIAATQKKPLSRKGSPLVDNPIDPRGGLPWYYLLETPTLGRSWQLTRIRKRDQTNSFNMLQRL